jgi:hypothetical protein
MSPSLKLRFAVQQDQGGWPESSAHPARAQKDAMRPLLVALLVTLAAVGAPRLARAVGTPARCAARKMKETGKKAGRKLTCWSKEVAKPGTYDACAAKAEVKFAAAFALAEFRGGCLSFGDAGALEAKVDAFVNNVVGALTGSPAGALLGTSEAQKCARTKLKAAGKKTAAKLTCQANAVISGALNTLCISRAEATYDQKWDGAEAMGGCATTSDQAAIEARVDAFVNDAVSELPATTTTTTSTTTTTTLLPCGSDINTCSSGACPEGQTCQAVLEAGTNLCFFDCRCVPESGVCEGCSAGPCPPGQFCLLSVSSCGGVCESSQCGSIGGF